MPTIREWLAKAQSQLAESTAFDDDIHLTLKFLVQARIHSQKPFRQEAALSEIDFQQLDNDLTGLCRGVPLPYIISDWSFYGLDFSITPDVLIPRPETELLVDTALQWLHSHQWPKSPRIYDIGTGSGIIAIAVAMNFSSCEVTATDISEQALKVCTTNIKKYELSSTITPLLADGLPKNATGIDLLCANLPYIPAKTVNDLKVARFEPKQALDGGSDGFRIIETVLRDSVPAMKPHSLLLFEIEERQKNLALTIAQKHFPHSTITVLKDLGNKDRLLRIENDR